MNDDEPEYRIRSLVEFLRRAELGRIEVAILDFVYWNDRWPENILHYEGELGPPVSPDENIHWNWIKVSTVGHRYICLL